MYQIEIIIAIEMFHTMSKWEPNIIFFIVCDGLKKKIIGCTSMGSSDWFELSNWLKSKKKLRKYLHMFLENLFLRIRILVYKIRIHFLGENIVLGLGYRQLAKKEK